MKTGAVEFAFGEVDAEQNGVPRHRPDEGVVAQEGDRVGRAADEAEQHRSSEIARLHDRQPYPNRRLLAPLFPVRLQAMHGGRGAGAAAQGFLQTRRPAMLFQQIAERLVGELLEVFHLIAAEQIERAPGLVVELDAFARHQSMSRKSGNRFCEKDMLEQKCMSRKSGNRFCEKDMLEQKCMSRKSGNRFCEKDMLKQTTRARFIPL